ncbi:MAG TPA: glycosyltransferase [Terriglobales bacterium]|nr:glycosyltransferase [Terriglobales bacterium]
MRIFVFGSSLTSSYWNGAATYYRGIYKSLHALGYEITFAEPNIYKRQQNRDLQHVPYADVVVYQTPADISKVLHLAAKADVIIKHSGVGADDELLEREVLQLRNSNRVTFWDVDAPATLDRVEADPTDPFRPLIPQYDFIFTYGGGPPVVEHYGRLGAKNCTPIYNGLDPETHHPVFANSSLACDLAFVGNRLPDREQRVEQFFLRAAELAPEMKFVLGGEGWGGRALPPNVRWIGHVGTNDHNRVNCSARMVLNINRESMASVGFSPPTRVFEAAGAAACLITDSWTGVDEFFSPGKEILVASSAEDIVGYLRELSATDAAQIGRNMRRRALAEHSYNSRVLVFHGIISSAVPGRRESAKLVSSNT